MPATMHSYQSALPTDYSANYYKNYFNSMFQA